jgi:hypothetical protein
MWNVEIWSMSRDTGGGHSGEIMKRMAIIGVVVVLGVSCSATGSKKSAARLQVHTQYDESTKFQQWKTFRMASSRPSDTDHSRIRIYEKMVRESLIAQLTDRGYQRADEEETDFRVAFELTFSGAKAPDGYQSSHQVDTAPEVSRGTQTMSTLIVKMLDPVTSEVLWEGRLSGFEVEAVAPELAIDKAVWRMLVEFPPITS